MRILPLARLSVAPRHLHARSVCVQPEGVLDAQEGLEERRIGSAHGEPARGVERGVPGNLGVGAQSDALIPPSNALVQRGMHQLPTDTPATMSRVHRQLLEMPISVDLQDVGEADDGERRAGGMRGTARIGRLGDQDVAIMGGALGCRCRGRPVLRAEAFDQETIGRELDLLQSSDVLRLRRPDTHACHSDAAEPMTAGVLRVVSSWAACPMSSVIGNGSVVADAGVDGFGMDRVTDANQG